MRGTATLHHLRRIHLPLSRRRLDRGRGPRPVRGIVVQAEEIRFRRVRGGFDISAGPVAQQVGDVAGPLDREFGFVKVMCAALADMRVVTGETAHDTEKLVVTAAQRAVAR